MSDTSPIVALLLASPGQRWGPVLGAVTVIDVLIVLLVAAAAVRGWQLGLTRLALGAGGPLAGAWAGLWAGSHLVPAGLSSAVTLLLQVGFVAAGALVGSGIGAAIGWRAATVLAAIHLRLIDRAGGAIARGTLALALCWLLAAGVAAFTPPAPSAAAAALTERSAVLRAVGELTPSVGALGRRVVAEVPVASDLVSMLPVSDEEVLADQPADAALASVSAAAAPATVRVQGTGCGPGVTGSGFVAAPHLVVTNAHVVAGAAALTVSDTEGSHPATAVVVETEEDLAVLRVGADLADPLPVADHDVAGGTPAVVLGYPGGGPLDAEAAVVTARLPLRVGGAAGGPQVGIATMSAWGEYRLAAQVLPGNSGGPLLDTGARVIGVVNARSLSEPDVGYAIPSTRVAPALADAEATIVAADTGACAVAAAPAR